MPFSVFRISISLVSILLGLYFVYKGLDKHWLSPCKEYPPESTIPLMYIAVISSFCASGFFKLIGTIQILSGLLLCIPYTRLVGALLLLPILANIFLIHLFLDNRPDELALSGGLLIALFSILFSFRQKLMSLFGDQNQQNKK